MKNFHSFFMKFMKKLCRNVLENVHNNCPFYNVVKLRELNFLSWLAARASQKEISQVINNFQPSKLPGFWIAKVNY